MTRTIGSSLHILRDVTAVNMFIRDSNHDPTYEFKEFLAVEENLDDSALVLTDNSAVSTALFDWPVERGRQYLNFREEPVVRSLIPEATGASWRLP